MASHESASHRKEGLHGSEIENGPRDGRFPRHRRWGSQCFPSTWRSGRCEFSQHHKSGSFTASENLALVDGDIGDPSTAAKITETAVQRFGTIDAVVNNAGIFFSKPFLDYTAADFRSLVSTNLEGFLYVTQLAIQQMLLQKSGGSVISITTSVVDHPIAGIPAAVAMITKGGL